MQNCVTSCPFSCFLSSVLATPARSGDLAHSPIAVGICDGNKSKPAPLMKSNLGLGHTTESPPIYHPHGLMPPASRRAWSARLRLSQIASIKADMVEVARQKAKREQRR